MNKNMIKVTLKDASVRLPIAWNKGAVTLLLGVAILSGLYLTSLHSFLLFHSLAELFSILVAFSVFIIAWNSRRSLDNNYLLFIGVAYLFIGFLDLIHTLSYKGMGVFQGYNANLPTQMWIVARYIESLSLIIATAFIRKRLNPNLQLSIYLAITALILSAVFYWGIFPDCFLDGFGLTSFKKWSEFIISLVLLSTVILLFTKKNEFDPVVFKLLILSILTTIGAEMAFTYYVSIYGVSNLVGHFFKLISFYLIYQAVVVTGLQKPYDLIYRKLKESENKLIHERDHLKKTLEEIKVLSGLLPICSYCKKIRDDSGYWSQLETYINKHSMADFSHSICPDCELELFSENKLN